MGCRDFGIELHQIEVLLCVPLQQQSSQSVTEPSMVLVHVNGHPRAPLTRVKVVQVHCADRVPFAFREKCVEHPAELPVAVQVVLPVANCCMASMLMG